jgi:aminoglycoside phosphotransferase (APT) family kinase protein
MCKILADLHSVDIEKIGLSDFGKPGNYFARQTDRWVKQYRISRLKEDIVMEKVIIFLENNLPLDDEQISLVHGDYRLDNMIFDNNHPKIIGLLDWELSTLGHPLADLAYQCMQWRLPYQGGMRGLNGLNRTELGIPLEEEYVEKYCEIRGISKIDNWNFYLVFSFFRLAAILEGVVMRAREGNASNPERAKKMSVAIPVLINMAAQLIKD